MSFAVIFCFFVTYRIIGSKFINSGDSFWHYSNEIHILRSIEAGRGIFDCLHKGLWIPLANFYQPLFYLAVVFMYRIFSGSVSIYFFHNLLVCLLFSIYPLSVYYLARSFKFDIFKAGMISLFSVFPISGWGHTIDAYFSIGLHTQLIGAVLFPVVLGTAQRLSRPGKAKNKVFVFAVTIAGLLMGHAVFGILCLYSLILYGLFFLFWRGWNSFFNLIGKFLAGALLGGLIIAFWLIPFVDFNSRFKFIPESERSFSRLAVSVTPKIFINTFLKGEFLDNTSPQSPLFGGGEEGLRWPVNDKYRRFAVFTIFTLCGLALFLLKKRKFRELFFVLFFFFAAFLFMGKDDLPFLRYLPYSRDFQPIRAVFIFELACAVLAACAFCEAFVRLDKFMNKNNKNIVVYLLFILLLPPLTERYKNARNLVQSFVSDKHLELGRIINAVKTEDPQEMQRTYYGRAAGTTNLALRSFADCGFINNAVGHDNEMAGSLSRLINGIQDTIPYSPQLLNLFNIGFMITSSGWQRYKIEQRQFPAGFSLLYPGTDFDLYTLDNQAGLFEPSKFKPVFVWCSNENWYNLNKLWLSLFAKNNGKISPMVKLPENFCSLIDRQYADKIILINIPSYYQTDKKYRAKFLEFQENGGTIISNRLIKSIPSLRLSPSNSDLFWESLKGFSENEEKPVQIKTDILGLNKYRLNFKFADEGNWRLIIAKTAYYNCWVIKNNRGKKIFPLWVSPGFTGFFAGHGINSVNFEYVPSVLHFILLTAGIMVFLCFCLIIKNDSLFFQRNKKIVFYHFEGLASYIKIFRFFIILICLYILILYIGQQFFYKTSLVYPYDGQKKVNPYEVVFMWNKLSDNETYSIQVSDSACDFANPVFELKGYLDDNVGYRGLKAGRWYYWRIKINKNGRYGCWSDVYSFKTGAYSPVVLD